MFEYGPFEDNAIFQTLGDQPRQVYRSVNTDRGEACGAVDVWTEVFLWDLMELSNTKEG